MENKIKTIMIIGAGQLGSRHLQAILLSSIPLNVIVVDPDRNSMEMAESRANEITLGNEVTKINYVTAIYPGTQIDLCIIATTANIRFAVFKELTLKRRVKNIIFEKVLFQKESDYTETARILESNSINAWVNCTRRMYPSYQKIRNLLAEESKIKMSVSGNQWGIGCNGIHFIDLFAYLTGNTDYMIDGSLLIEDVSESKRSGFFEVYGLLVGTSLCGNSFELLCKKGGESSKNVEIVSPNYQVVIKETGGELIITHNAKSNIEAFQFVNQSELTHFNLEEIISDGSCSLTSFEDSMKLHLPFIKVIKKHIEKVRKESLDVCPIT